MALINTTHGALDAATLARTTGFEDRPTEFVVWEEWRLGDELVRRDAHVILKEPQVVADAIATPPGADVTVGIGGVRSHTVLGKVG